MVLEVLISSSAPIGAYTFALETALRFLVQDLAIGFRKGIEKAFNREKHNYVFFKGIHLEKVMNALWACAPYI